MKIIVGSVEIQPQVSLFGEGSWSATLYIDRWLAKGHLRDIWNQFVAPARWGAHCFAREPHLRRGPDGDWIMTQSGGLDI